MSNIYYLKNTLDNIDNWFNGFATYAFELNVDNFPHHQICSLYEKHISEIIQHAKDILKDIEDGVVNEA